MNQNSASFDYLSSVLEITQLETNRILEILYWKNVNYSNLKKVKILVIITKPLKYAHINEYPNNICEENEK